MTSNDCRTIGYDTLTVVTLLVLAGFEMSDQVALRPGFVLPARVCVSEAISVLPYIRFWGALTSAC